jgi:hypothetical protein
MRINQKDREYWAENFGEIFHSCLRKCMASEWSALAYNTIEWSDEAWKNLCDYCANLIVKDKAKPIHAITWWTLEMQESKAEFRVLQLVLQQMSIVDAHTIHGWFEDCAQAARRV